MNFDLTEERQMLQDGLRRYLADTVTDESRAATFGAEPGYAPEVWQGLAEMGVIGALFSEEDGGYGGAGFDLMVVFEELGRAGATEPLLEVVLAGSLIAALGSGEQKALIEEVIAGTAHLALAHGEPASRYDLERVETAARREGDGWVLDGRKSVVVNGAAADHFVVSARTAGEVDSPEGISLFVVPAGTAGLQLRSYPLTGGGHAAELVLDGAALPADALLGEEGAGHDPLEAAVARGTAALSAEALGAMETIRGLTAEYLRTRKQFGQPIGKFQALQHRMADMLIEIEQARSAVINLCGHAEAPRATRELHVSAAKQLVGATARLVTEESIQLHGGIGMTQEYGLAHFVRRLTMADHRLGDAEHHLSRFIRLRAA